MLAKRAKKKDTEGENLVLLGDFNIFVRTDATFTADGRGLRGPERAGPGREEPRKLLPEQVADVPDERSPPDVVEIWTKWVEDTLTARVG